MRFYKTIFVFLLGLFAAFSLTAQGNPIDSLAGAKVDSIAGTPASKVSLYDSVLKKLIAPHSNLATFKKGIVAIATERRVVSKDNYFYLLTGILLLLAFLRAFFSKYFTTFFKVFFNTSLKQNQLSDQLKVAKLPSLLLNIFFCVSVGVFAYILFQYYAGKKSFNSSYLLLPTLALSAAIVYTVKYLVLKFTGILTGLKSLTNNYIFVIFLVNKMLGLLLIPLSIFLVYGGADSTNTIVIISLIFVGIMFSVRYIKAYSLLQYKIQVPIYQFVLYIIGLEIIPLLVIIKVATQFFDKIN